MCCPTLLAPASPTSLTIMVLSARSYGHNVRTISMRYPRSSVCGILGGVLPEGDSERGRGWNCDSFLNDRKAISIASLNHYFVPFSLIKKEVS